jgi:hypothetical protein
MSNAQGKKFTVGQVLVIQAVASFVVIGILILLGGLLVFKVMGTEYTQFTAMGFIAAVYLSFIVFQPAGTLFAARKELIEGKVVLPGGAKSPGPVVNPWKKTLPLSLPVGLACTAAVLGGIHASGATPPGWAVVALSLLYVIPYYFVTKKYLEPDLVSLAVNGPGTGAGESRSRYFWGTYILPNLVFQSIINLPLAIRGFSHEAFKLAMGDPGLQGMVPLEAVWGDLTVTFMFVCSFTSLAAATYTLSGIYQGFITFDGLSKGKGIHGFFFFLNMLAMGFMAGILYVVVMNAAGMQNIPFEAAMLSKLCTVFLAVYLGSRMAQGWTAKKVRAHIEAQAAGQAPA